MGNNKITVVQMLPDLHSGGVERGTLELGAFLSEKGHRSIVISGGGRLVKQLEAEGSRHVNWQVGEKSLSTFRYILPLRRLLLEQKVDILHLRSRVPAWVGYLAWKSLPASQRPKLVTTFHGFYSITRFSAVMTRGEKVIAVSRTIADHIKENYAIDHSKIIIIPRGVDTEEFDPANIPSNRLDDLSAKWGITDDNRPVILLPGRITPLKGHEIFFKALEKFKDLSWLAVVVGDTAENPRHMAALEKMVREKDLQERVKFVGHCDDMPAAYLLSDLVISATHTTPESFGRTAVEASAMGKPVIASAHGGSMETVLPGKTGWLTRPGDSEDLAATIREALKDKQLRQRLGEQGRKRVLERFTVETMCDHTIKLYEHMTRS